MTPYAITAGDMQGQDAYLASSFVRRSRGRIVGNRPNKLLGSADLCRECAIRWSAALPSHALTLWQVMSPELY